MDGLMCGWVDYRVQIVERLIHRYASHRSDNLQTYSNLMLNNGLESNTMHLELFSSLLA